MTNQQPANFRHTGQELTRFFVAVALVSFVLHGIWDMSQMRAYGEMAERPFSETIVRCTPATLGDVLLTFWNYTIGAVAGYTISWGMKPRWNAHLTLAVLGLIHAIAIERFALNSGRWTYSSAMPIMPGLKVGFWPLLQLTVLTPLTIWFSSRFAMKHRKAINPASNFVL